MNDLKHLSSLEFAGRKTNTPGALATSDFIYSRFEELGYKAQLQKFTYRHGFFSTATGINVIARLTTDTAQAPLLIITAHYDHLGLKGNKLYAGANDNASGVSALLYLADTLRNSPRDFNIVFVATDAEANGLRGSKSFVSQLEAPNKKLNINLDMLAVKPSDPTLYIFTSYKLKQPISKLTGEIKNTKLNIRISSSTRQMNHWLKENRIDWRKASDHYAFTKVGINTLYFGMGEDQHHHKVTDTYENIDKPLYLATVSFIEQFIRRADCSVF